MISYVVGDATDPQGDGHKVIAHVCNDAGGFGKGFAAAVTDRFPDVRKNYMSWASRGQWAGMPFERGQTQFTQVHFATLMNSPETWVANMVAQEGYQKRYEDPPKRYLDYFSLGVCLERVAEFALEHEASVAMPRIGCGLAGGSWDVVEMLIKTYLIEQDVPVTVYDLP